MYILLYITWITNKDLLYSTGNSIYYYIITYMQKESEKEYTHTRRRKWQPTPVGDPLLLRESHGQRSLVGYSLWGRIGSDMTEVR